MGAKISHRKGEGMAGTKERGFWKNRRMALLVGVLCCFAMTGCQALREQGLNTGAVETTTAEATPAGPSSVDDATAMAAKAPPSGMVTEPELNARTEPDERAEPDEEKAKIEKPEREMAISIPFRKGLFTAYTSQRHQTDGTPFITADGTNLKTVKGCVVANNHLPFGTRVEIESVGECIVRDRGADGHPTHWFDIYMGMDHGRAEKFGRKELDYRVLP